MHNKTSDSTGARTASTTVWQKADATITNLRTWVQGRVCTCALGNDNYKNSSSPHQEDLRDKLNSGVEYL